MPATILDLREFRARDLDVLLRTQEEEWLHQLNWDFRGSSELVCKFVDTGSLNGAVAVSAAGTLTGYVYFVFEDGKGLLGDLYVMPEFRNPTVESQLMNSALRQIAEVGGVPRVEGQIMMLSAPLERPDSGWRSFEMLERSFLTLRLPAANGVKSAVPDIVAIEPWSHTHQEQAAQLIPATYVGHVDSRINDQYRNAAGARKFLHNIVQYPGCGVFHESASFSAFHKREGRLCGLVLSSMVSGTSGHVTQVCVLPEHQGLGLGRELMRRALQALERNGCRTVSLTVTQENRGARMLYERLGFRMVKKFGAYVWTP